jgi:hypothetical protein
MLATVAVAVWKQLRMCGCSEYIGLGHESWRADVRNVVDLLYVLLFGNVAYDVE